MGIKITNGGLIKRNPTYIGLIFGSPKGGKTSLAAGAKKPLLLDIDKGAHRTATKDRAGMDIAIIDHYTNDFLPLISSPELKNYDTIVVDTFGALVDIIIRDKFSGQMNPSKWGIIKTEVIMIANTLRMTGKSIIFLAHETEENNDGKIIKRPQCQGKAKDELMKMLDFIGHMTKSGNDFILEFGGDDSVYCGNTYGFENRYVLPDIKIVANDFWQRVIEPQIANFLEQEEMAGDALRECMAKYTEKIAKLEVANDFVLFLQELSAEKDLTSGAVLKIKKDLVDAASAKGFVFDKEAKCFIKSEKQGG